MGAGQKRRGAMLSIQSGMGAGQRRRGAMLSNQKENQLKTCF